MCVGGVALIRRRLDTLDRQRDEEQRRAAEGIAVASDDGAFVGFDIGGEAIEIGAARRAASAITTRSKRAATASLPACWNSPDPIACSWYPAASSSRVVVGVGIGTAGARALSGSGASGGEASPLR